MPGDGRDSTAERRRAIVGDGGPSLLDRIFGSLSHPRRRCVLYYLREKGQAEVDEVATVVAAWEHGVPTGEVSTDARERIRKELLHVHIPKLEDYGLVDYDLRSATVSYTYPPTVLDDIVDLAATIEEPP